MHGDTKYQPGFQHFDYANPDAPKDGELRLSQIGSFDSLNPYIIHGVAATGRHLVFESLMQRSADEPFSLYGLLAERIETPPDRAWVEFYLNPKARFQDGQPVTIDDVIFSLETLRDHGRPNHHAYYSQVSKIERKGENGVRFTFGGDGNRELPLIMGLMPILPKHFFANTTLNETRLQPITGSGPYSVEKVDAGRRISYKRNANYWGEDLPVSKGRHNFDHVIYDYFRDKNTAQEAFRAGDIDFQNEQSPQQWATGYDFEAVTSGQVIKAEIPHGRPSGMRAFVFNTRKEKFQDLLVRQALLQAFDFDWINKNLFHGAYQRTRSYFGNSDLEAPLIATAEELALAKKLGESSSGPACTLCRPLAAMPHSGGASNRKNLMAASRLLAQAGWKIKDGKLQNAQGQPFTFEILLADPSNTRLAQQFSRDLSRLGIDVTVRLVDSAQYQQRANEYDFDMIIYFWGQSLSPGNEQAFYWGTAAAKEPGTRNYMGVQSPLIDAAIRSLVSAVTREDLVTSTRLVDRTLRAGYYVVPLYHQRTDRVAYWARLQRPATTPLLGYSLESWWSDPARK